MSFNAYNQVSELELLILELVVTQTEDRHFEL